MARVEISEVVLAGRPLAPVAGAAVQVNVRGGSAATVYVAESGGSTRTNPLTTDAQGRIEGWVDAGSYNLVVSGTGITDYTQAYEAARGDAAGNGAETDTAALAALATHAADTTAIHGITDTSVLATSSSVASAVSTHEADTTAVHGIADTSKVAIRSSDSADTGKAIDAYSGAPLPVGGGTPDDGSVTNAKVAASAAIAESKLALASDAAAGTASRRTLGTSATSAAAGNDARLSDTRVPTDGSVTNAKVGASAAIAQSKLALAITDAEVASGAAIAKSKLASLAIVNADVDAAAAIAESKLALASDAAAGTASRRTLGTGATQAMQGSLAAPLASPALTGNPTAPTQSPADNSTKLATTAYADAINAARLAAESIITGNEQTANYTLVLGDAGKVIEVNNASARTVTVPLNSSVAFPVGTVIEVLRYGAGSATIVATGGVTIRSRGSLLAIGNQYGAVSLRKRATDEWVLVGDLA